MRVRNPVSRVLEVVSVVSIAGCLMLTGCVAPSPSPSTKTAASTSSGDEELLDLIRPSFIDSSDRAAVAVIEGGEVRTAFIDADDTTVFEIGSITKVFTGELLAEAVERGEVELTDALGEHLDLGDAPVASVNLRDLAAHRSGLATFPDDPAFVERVTADYEAGRDPFDERLDEVLEAARGMELTTAGTFSYSNMGATLLGHALAAAAGTDYQTLLSDRLLDPLDLEHASLPLTDDELSDAHAGGFDAEGDPVEPSTLAGYAPAGGIHATIGDLVTFATAVIDGPLAGSAAQTDTINLSGGSRIGYFWSVDQSGGRTIVSHNGQTLGFSSAMLIDLQAGRAAIVLSNQAELVDDVAATLLAHLD
jgi:CubicO group peptidase (beta-lactamase class C family)